MKVFLKSVYLFFIPPLVLYLPFCWFVLPVLLQKTFGPSTKQQIEQSFENALSRDYNLLFMGNSRVYRGINPDMIEQGGYNFSHDDDSFNQAYHKLIYLQEKGKKIDHLVLGVDYFQFSFLSDKRNYAYEDYFGAKYLSDFDNPSMSRYKRKYYIDLLDLNKLKQLPSLSPQAELKANGQYLRKGKASVNDFITRDSQRLDLLVAYFGEILAYCQYNDIKVYLLMMPTRAKELENYTPEQIEDFENFINNYKSQFHSYWDFSTNHDFQLKDFSDITHLNKKAADRFSRMLSDSLQSVISVK